MIAGNPNIREVSTQVIKAYFEKYKSDKVQFTKDVEQGAQSQPGTYEAAKKKIVSFFQDDSSRFYQDLVCLDPSTSQTVSMEQLFHYLNTLTINLTKEEKTAIMSKFRAVTYTKVSVEYVTSMFFFGRANLQISHIVQQPFCVQQFFLQMQNEMNLTMKGSFDIFK